MTDSLFMGKNGFIWWFGVVENNADPLGSGRCQVRIDGWHSQNQNDIPTQFLPWANVVLPISNANINGIGQSPIGPQPGTRVCGWFLDGKIGQQPIIFGVLSGVSNQIKDIRLQDGSTPIQPNQQANVGQESLSNESDDPSDPNKENTVINELPKDSRDIQISPGEWVIPATGFVSSKFGPRGSGRHYGVDISPAGFFEQTSKGAPPVNGMHKGVTGQPVYAAADGIVTQIWTSDKGQKGISSQYDSNYNVSPDSPQRSYGNGIYIRHKLKSGEFGTVYAHLGSNQDPALDSPGSGILVKVGERVSKGQQIGTMGRTHNRSTPTHLHFEIISGNSFGNKINPGIIFPQLLSNHTSFLSWMQNKPWNAKPEFDLDDAPVRARTAPES